MAYVAIPREVDKTVECAMAHLHIAFERYCKGVLNKHVREVHLDINDHKCEYIAESFHRKEKLIVHLVSKHDNEPHKKHASELCGYRSIKQVYVYHHIKS